MADETTAVLVIGAGQAGVAMSAHLRREGVPHVVLDRGRIAEAWRSHRWDALVANGPAWHDRFPDMDYPGDPDAFPPKEAVADYMEAYARRFGGDIREGVEVLSVARREGAGFIAHTTTGTIKADQLVLATGGYQQPRIPALVPDLPGLTQIHSVEYRNPGALAPGAVLVVGAGSSGVQIADELNRAGRRVYLSVGQHDRPPRRYRDRDNVWWLGVLNKWDMEATPGVRHTTIAVSGARGGETIDLRSFGHQGITLTGRTTHCDGSRLHFAPDLRANIERGDANYLAVLDEADAWIARNHYDLPEEPGARVFPADPPSLTDPLESLDLQAARVSTIIWATGFGFDYSWVQMDLTDAQGRPRHTRGVSVQPGVYFLGLPWQTRRGSSFIWGVWYDAKYITDHIVKQRLYLSYRPGSGTPS